MTAQPDPRPVAPIVRRTTCRKHGDRLPCDDCRFEDNADRAADYAAGYHD